MLFLRLCRAVKLSGKAGAPCPNTPQTKPAKKKEKRKKEWEKRRGGKRRRRGRRNQEKHKEKQLSHSISSTCSVLRSTTPQIPMYTSSLCRIAISSLCVQSGHSPNPLRARPAAALLKQVADMCWYHLVSLLPVPYIVHILYTAWCMRICNARLGAVVAVFCSVSASIILRQWASFILILVS